MPSVGDLYVNLGIKGTDKTLGAIRDTKSGMGDLASVSIEAKAAIAAVLFGFEQLMSASSRLGTHLANAGVLLGIPTKILQQYDYAARIAGASTGEMESSFKGLEGAMANIKLNKGVAEGLKFINLELLRAGQGSINLEKAKQDIPYLFQKLQQFAQIKHVPPEIRARFLEGLGLGDNIISGMIRNFFTQANFKKAPIYTDSDIKKLDEANQAWIQLAANIERAIGQINILVGSPVAKALAKVFEPYQEIKPQDKLKKDLDELRGKFPNWKGFPTPLDTTKEDLPGDVLLQKAGGKIQEIFKHLTAPADPAIEAARKRRALDVYQPRLSPNVGQTNNVTINQDVQHYGDAKDTRAVGSLQKQAAKDAMSTQKVKALSPGQAQRN